MRFEGFADAPAARLAVRVDVAEHAQQPGALHRVGRKRVDVQPCVVLAPARLAPGDVDRPERGVAALQVGPIVREEAQCKRFALLCITHDHRLQCRQLGCVAERAAQLAARVFRAPSHRDVLRLAVGPARVEETALRLIQHERQPRKAQHHAVFDNVLDAARRSVVGPGRVGELANDVDAGGIGRRVGHEQGRVTAEKAVRKRPLQALS